MIRLLCYSFLFIIGIQHSAVASYFQAELPSSNSDPEMGVHLIVTGKGIEVADEWLRAGQTQALIFKDRQRHGTIRLIGAIENSKTLPMLKKWGYQNIQIFNQTFTGPRLVELLLLNSKVESLDMIGHNGALLGFVLEDYDHRFFIDDVKSLAGLADKMSPNSFVRLMGCNTGWSLAPSMSQFLKVPVSGVFTFADIQNLHSFGEWYYHDKGRYPEEGYFLGQNNISFFNSIECIMDGGCLRLKPVQINYQGKHGNYKGTVPFSKFFCGPVNSDDCFRRMAYSTIYLVGNAPVRDIPTSQQFEDLMADHFCPSYVDQNKKKKCNASIINHMNEQKLLPPTFTNSDGPTLQCNFQKCSFKTDCSTGKCILIGTFDNKISTTFVDELNAYKKGFILLNSAR